MSDDGGPAFPSSDSETDPRNPGWRGDGVSKRDYFAARAMAVLLQAVDGMGTQVAQDEMNATGTTGVYSLIALRAYEMADKMIAERAK